MATYTNPFFYRQDFKASSEPFKEKSSDKNHESFPVKLMHILQMIDTKEPELAHIISWQPNGTTFRIHDKRLFEKLVKQRGFFNQKSYSSFRRQLNLWGFKKIGKRCKADCGVYGHPMFLRENPRLCNAMSRTGGSNKVDSIKALVEQENAAKIINSSIQSSAFHPPASESKFDVTAVTESTKSIDTDDQSSLKQQEEYQYYGNLRKPSKNILIKPPCEDEVCSSTYYNNSTTSFEENDETMLQELECFDFENAYTSQQESRFSSSNLFNSNIVEHFDEHTFCEIEPLQLDEEMSPLPSSYKKYLRDALGN